MTIMTYTAQFGYVNVRFARDRNGAGAPVIFLHDLYAALSRCLLSLTEDQCRTLIYSGAAEHGPKAWTGYSTSQDGNVITLNPTISAFHVFTLVPGLHRALKEARMNTDADEVMGFGDWFAETLQRANKALGYTSFDIMAGLGIN